MAHFKTAPKKQRVIGVRAELHWGPSYGANGLSFVSEHEGPRDPGPIETELSLRRVSRREINGDELQILIEIRQRYRSGANSRRVLGSISLHGAALEDFLARATKVEE